MIFDKQFYRVFSLQLQFVMDDLQKSFREELANQGHVNTGKLSDSIEYEIEILAEAIVANFYFEDYGFAIDQGVPANRIPFNPGSGARKSKYIEGLIKYFQSKGILNDRDLMRRVFATAYSHKRQGMPTRGSFAYSNNGRRKGFVQSTLNDNSDKILTLIERTTFEGIESSFNDMINNLSIQFK